MVRRIGWEVITDCLVGLGAWMFQSRLYMQGYAVVWGVDH